MGIATRSIRRNLKNSHMHVCFDRKFNEDLQVHNLTFENDEPHVWPCLILRPTKKVV